MNEEQMELSNWESSHEPSKRLDIAAEFRKLQSKIRGEPD